MRWLMGDPALLLVGRTATGAAVLGRVIRPDRAMGSYIWERADGSAGGVATTQLTAMRALEREVGA